MRGNLQPGPYGCLLVDGSEIQQSFSGLSVHPALVIGGVVLSIFSAGSLMLALKGIIKEWRSGAVAPQKTAQDSTELLNVALRSRSEGDISASEYSDLLSTLEASLPSGLLSGSVSTFFSKHGTSIIVGALTVVASTFALKLLFGRK